MQKIQKGDNYEICMAAYDGHFFQALVFFSSLFGPLDPLLELCQILQKRRHESRTIYTINNKLNKNTPISY